jgi:hypothetical protein
MHGRGTRGTKPPRQISIRTFNMFYSYRFHLFSLGEY